MEGDTKDMLGTTPAKPVFQQVFWTPVGWTALDTNGFLWRKRLARKGPNGESIWLRIGVMVSESDIFTADADFGVSETKGQKPGNVQ